MGLLLMHNRSIIFHRTAFFICLVFLFAFALDRAHGSSAETHPLSLREDAVVVTGKDLSALLGAKISSLNLAVVINGELRPIPFQVDEMRNGSHVFDWVSPLGAKEGFYTQDEDGGKLDGDDELVFMAFDLGERAAAGFDFKSGKVAELSFNDPVSGKTGYAYLLADSSLPKSQADYVKLEIAPPRYNIFARRYKYSGLADRGFFDNLRIAKSNGDWTPNLILRDRTPGHAKLRLVGFSADFDFYDLIRGEVIARKDGPVRLLWRCAGGADFGGLKIKAKGSTEQVFYANRIDIPVAMDLPFNFDSILQSFEIKGTLLLDPASLPVMFYDKNNSNGVRVDGKSETGNPRLVNDKPIGWFAVSSPGASLYFMVIFPKEWIPKLKRTAYMEDTPKRSEVGCEFGDLVHLLSKGFHEYILRFYILSDDFQWGNEKRMPEISEQSLNLTVNELR